MGLIVCRAWSGEEYRGDFSALVSEEISRQVQVALRSPDQPPTGRHVSHEDFPLRRFVTCGTCGSPLTGSWSRGKLGRRYAYYNCRRHCAGQSAAKGTLEAAFLELTQTLVPSPGYLRLLRRLVLDAWAAERNDVARRRQGHQAMLETLRRKARMLDDRFIYQGAVDQATCTHERDRLREEILLTEMELSDAQLEMIDVEGILASAEDIITNAASLWREGTLQQRERLQWLLYPEGLKWDRVPRGAFRTPTTCLSFYQLALIQDVDLGIGVSEGIRTPNIRSHSPALCP